nr:ribonuclease H-like domain-containing protein [Tanacetum cinerariifolium]
VKRSGDVTRLQALVDKKRIVITKEVVCEILQLNDAEGIICLPNDEIFAGLARMGYEKPSTKLTFYKAFYLQLLRPEVWPEQLEIKKGWILVDLPYGKRVIGTKWVYRNKKYKRGIVIRNKARLVAQGHTQEEGIDYEEVFAQ